MTSADGSRRASRGLSEAAFRERSGTEAACREALFATRWREGPTCPACGGSCFCRLRTRKVFQCDRRKKQPSLAAGTVLQDAKLPLTAWCAAIYQLTQAKGAPPWVGPAGRRGGRQPRVGLVEQEP